MVIDQRRIKCSLAPRAVSSGSTVYSYYSIYLMSDAILSRGVSTVKPHAVARLRIAHLANAHARECWTDLYLHSTKGSCWDTGLRALHMMGVHCK